MKIKTREIVLFAMLGTIMFISKLLMEFLPNIHMLGALTMIYTIAYRKKALIPIYIYVILNGVYAGFNVWWIPYTYIWTILWAWTMLLPKNIKPKIAMFIYPIVCGFHGLLFGALYAPAQAIMFGLSFSNTIRWIIAGLPFDALHAAGNVVIGILILPLSQLLIKLDKQGSAK